MLREQRGVQRLRRLAAELDALDGGAEAEQRGGRALARAGGVGQLLLGALARLRARGDASPRARARCADSCAARFDSRARPRGGRDRAWRRGVQAARAPRPSFGGALGGGRLQRERPQALAHLGLDVAGALDLRGDAGELQLRAVAAVLEAPEPRGLLDELAPLGRLGAEHGLDAALRDHRAQPAAEADVGEQLDQVDPPARRRG